jgi:hypothetical protein
VHTLTAISIALASFFLPASHATEPQISPKVFQITNDPAEQNGPLIDDNLVAYTNWAGSQGIDIWGYDLTTKTNFPIIEKAGTQFLDGLHDDLVVYEDFDEGTHTYKIHLYNRSTGEDTLVTPGSASYGSGGTDGTDVVYIDGYACGKLMVYHIKSGLTEQLSGSACTPKISSHNVVWLDSANGPKILGYHLSSHRQYVVYNGNADGCVFLRGVILR